MNFRDLAYEIFTALKANKGRSALTILGIVIGITAVVTMTSLIDGMKNTILESVGADQARVISVSSLTQALQEEDMQYLKENVKGVEYAGFAIQGSGTVIVGSAQKSMTILGASDDYFKSAPASFQILHGRLLTESDNTALRQVVVLDAKSNKELFGEEEIDSVGRTIKIEDEKYLVVGVLKAGRNSALQTTSIYIPSNTSKYRLTGTSEFFNFMVLARDGEDIDATRTGISTALDKRYPMAKEAAQEIGFQTAPGQEPSGFMVMTSKDVADQVGVITSVFSAILGSVAGISLLVGGIGIMNMMLTNVTERIREIGLRKAIGAHRSDITNQFLGESIVLCLIGGVLGLIFGYLLAVMLSALITLFMPGISVTPLITPSIMLIAFGVSAFIGVAFGFWPAHRAAKLDPVESLRHQ